MMADTKDSSAEQEQKENNPVDNNKNNDKSQLPKITCCTLITGLSPILCIVFLVIFALIVSVIPENKATYDGYCTPDKDEKYHCWPTDDEIESELIDKLSKYTKSYIYANIDSFSNTKRGQYYSYLNSTNPLNLNQYPSFIIVCKDVSDIQTAIKFASSFNIQISIYSTGSSFSGRSSANNSLQINLSKMKGYKLNENVTRITVESGLTWIEIYNITDKYDKLIVGGRGHSVGPVGYSLGAGHSPLSATYGLAVDWIKELYLIDANGDIIHVFNDSDNTEISDLFWAVRGGGGSTFGVVVNITFEIHDGVKTSINNNATYNEFKCLYSWYDLVSGEYVAEDILNNFWSFINNKQLSTNYNGYLVVGKNRAMDLFYIVFILMYPGNYDDAYINIEALMNYKKTSQIYCYIDPHETYIEYIEGQTDTLYRRTFIFSNLISNYTLSDKTYSKTILNYVGNNTKYNKNVDINYVHILIHGAVHNFDIKSSSINPKWRNSVFLSGSAIYWDHMAMDDEMIEYGKSEELQFKKYSNGKYSNEENAYCPDCDWSNAFWGDSNYQILSTIKQKWDPNSVFYCNHCVGDDS